MRTNKKLGLGNGLRKVTTLLLVARRTMLRVTIATISLLSITAATSESINSSLDRMLTSLSKSDAEVDSQELSRRMVARSRLESPLCYGSNDSGKDTAAPPIVSPVACVTASYIPSDKTYLVIFQHDESGDDPSVCWNMCRSVFPNTSVALVSRAVGVQDGASASGLDCHCGMGDALGPETIGPSGLCDVTCEKSGLQCGGKKTFANGFTEETFSVYCIPVEAVLDDGQNDETRGSHSQIKKKRSVESVNNLQRVESIKKGDAAKGERVQESMEVEIASNTTSDINQVLHDIWSAQMRTNIIAIVMIGLLVLVIILVLVLLVWVYLFVESCDSAGQQSLFYRRLSGSKQRPQALHQQQRNGASTNTDATQASSDALPKTSTSTYGATNQVIKQECSTRVHGCSMQRQSGRFASHIDFPPCCAGV